MGAEQGVGAGAPPWRGFRAESGLYARIGLPILVSQLSAMTNGVIDTLMAGRSDRMQVGGFVRETGLDASLELAGVAIGNGIWVSLMMTCMGFLLATTPMVAELYGAGRMHQIGTLVRRLAWSALLLGVLLGALSLTAAALVEPWMKPDTGRVTAGYLQVIALGALPLMAATLLRCYSEGMTLTRPITAINLLGVLLNVPLNAIFIFGLVGLEPMGGVGCALATALVNWIIFAVTLGYVRLAPAYRDTRLFRSWRLPVHRYTIARQLRLGTPIAATLLVELSMFPGIALLIAIEQMPDAVTAGHQVALTMAGLLYMFPLSIALTATVRMGNLVGAGHHRALGVASRFPLYVASVVALCNTLVLLFFRQDIAGFFSNVPEVVTIASQLLVYAMVFQFFDGLQGTALGILRGLKSTLVPMFCIALSYWVVGIPSAWLMAFVGLPGSAPLGIDGLWLGMTLGLATAAATLLSYQAGFVPRFRLNLAIAARQSARRRRTRDRAKAYV